MSFKKTLFAINPDGKSLVFSPGSYPLLPSPDWIPKAFREEGLVKQYLQLLPVLPSTLKEGKSFDPDVKVLYIDEELAESLLLVKASMQSLDQGQTSSDESAVTQVIDLIRSAFRMILPVYYAPSVLRLSEHSILPYGLTVITGDTAKGKTLLCKRLVDTYIPWNEPISSNNNSSRGTSYPGLADILHSFFLDESEGILGIDSLKALFTRGGSSLGKGGIAKTPLEFIADLSNLAVSQSRSIVAVFNPQDSGVDVQESVTNQIRASVSAVITDIVISDAANHISFAMEDRTSMMRRVKNLKVTFKEQDDDFSSLLKKEGSSLKSHNNLEVLKVKTKQDFETN